MCCDLLKDSPQLSTPVYGEGRRVTSMLGTSLVMIMSAHRLWSDIESKAGSWFVCGLVRIVLT